MKNYLKRFANPGTVLSLVSVVGLLLIQFGFKIDLVWLDNTAKLVCSLGIILGAMNNPTTPGIDLPVIGEKENNQK